MFTVPYIFFIILLPCGIRHKCKLWKIPLPTMFRDPILVTCFVLVCLFFVFSDVYCKLLYCIQVIIIIIYFFLHSFNFVLNFLCTQTASCFTESLSLLAHIDQLDLVPAVQVVLFSEYLEYLFGINYSLNCLRTSRSDI